MKKILSFFALFVFAYIGLYGQVVTTVPANPTAAESITVTLDVAGTALAGYTGDVYCHTGVTVSSATSDSVAWQHVIGSWGDNTVQPKLTSLGGGKYQLIISNIGTFYSVLPTEEARYLCFVFRSADGSLKAGSNDIFLKIYPSGLNIHVQSPTTSPYIVAPNTPFLVSATGFSAESISLSVDGVQVAQETGTAFTYNLTSVASDMHTITLTSVKGTATKSIDVYYYVVPTVNIASLPAGMKLGANYIDDNTVTLVFNDPAMKKKFVLVIGEFNNWQINSNYLMNRTPDGAYYWITLKNLVKGQEYAYQYLVDGTLNLADPYTTKILDPDNDKYITSSTYPNLKAYPAGATQLVSVFQTAQQAYQWQATNYVKPAQKNLNIYELLVRDFSATHNYQAIIDSISYFKRLNINAIELMPVGEFEGNDSWGYNPNFYFAPDKYYGVANDLKHLVDVCHQNGIAIILDEVLNHSYGSSSMVRMYEDAGNMVTLDNPWFNRVQINPNYQYGYDFNHESLSTQRLVDSITSYWLTEYKVDGFRFDFTKGFTQHIPVSPDDGSAYDASRVTILTRMSGKIWGVDPSAYVILEHFCANAEEQVLTNGGMMIWGNENYSYGQAGMSLNQSDLSWGTYKARGYTAPKLVTYMESHDEEREAFRIYNHGNKSNSNYVIPGSVPQMASRLELNAAFFFTIPGPKMIWQFGELGYDVSIDSTGGRVSDKPLKWDYEKVPERERLFSVYSSLMYLRNNYDVFSTDSYTYNGLATDSVKSLNLHSLSFDVAVVGNFDVYTRYAAPNFSSTGYWYDYFSGDSINVTDIHVKIKLKPGEYHIYSSKKLSTPNIITAPEVASIAVSGKNTIGSVLTGSYTYFDQNGDKEGSSLQKWFISPVQSGVSPTYRSTTGANYTITKADLQQYIFYEVTPVALTGGILTGKPVVVGLQNVILGLTSVEAAKLKVYPNPVVDLLNISLSEKITNVVLIDSNGRPLLNKATNGENQLIIDFTGYANGAYYILFNAKDGLAKTEKIIK